MTNAVIAISLSLLLLSCSGQAAKELDGKSEIAYFNVGAFICCIDNYIYIFTSHAAGFMYTIKPFFKEFVKESNAVVMKGTALM